MALNRQAIQYYQRQKQASNQTAAQQQPRQLSIPAPTGGINTVTALAAMPPTDAVDMVNWFPDIGGVKFRRGYEEFQSTQTSSAIETLASYNTGSLTELIAATDNTIFQVGASGGYIQVGVDFDNSVYLTHEAASNVFDVSTFSFWCGFDASEDGAESALFHIFGQDVSCYIYKNSSNKIVCHYTRAGGDPIDPIVSTSSVTSASGIVHVLIHAPSTGTARMYINNSLEATETDIGLAPNMLCDEISVGRNDSTGNVFSGYLGDVWMQDTNFDISDSDVRANFIDSDGFPVSLGSTGEVEGVLPLVFLTGDADDFLVNSGTESFTLTENSSSISTSDDTPSPIVLKSGMSNGRWQSVNFNSFIFFANGEDTPQTFDGSTFSNSSISGPTVTDLIGCNVFRNRLYVWEEDSQSVWYGDPNAIGGTFEEFPLGRVGTTGGKLTAMGTWTMDGGDGTDDVAVFIMSTGETLIYQGSDPTQWTLTGIFKLGKPLGVRAISKVGGDLLIATEEDYVRLSEVLQDRSRVKSKMSGAARDAARDFGSNTGWQVEFYPKGSIVLVNVPTSSTTFEQHVLNTITNAWTKYNDIQSFCWVVHDGDLYFGGDNGVIYKAETGNTDDGAAITARSQPAWTDFGVPRNKRATAIRPVMDSESAIMVTQRTGADFATLGNSQTYELVELDWHSWGDHGTHLGYEFTVSSSDEVNWYRTDVQATQGHFL